MSSTGNPLAAILSGFTKSFGGAMLQKEQQKHAEDIEKQKIQLQMLVEQGKNVRPGQEAAYAALLQQFTEDIGKGGKKAKKEKGDIASMIYGLGDVAKAKGQPLQQTSQPGQAGSPQPPSVAGSAGVSPQGMQGAAGARIPIEQVPAPPRPTLSARASDDAYRKPMLMTSAEKMAADFEAMKPQLDYQHKQEMEKIGLEAKARAELDEQRAAEAIHKQTLEDEAKMKRQNDREANAHLGKLPELIASFKREGLSDEEAGQRAAKMVTDDFNEGMRLKDTRIKSLNEGIINHRRALDQADERIAQSATRNSIAYLKVKNEIDSKGLKTEKDDALKSLGEASARLNQQMQRKAQIEANNTGKKPEEVAKELKALEPDIDGAVGAVSNAEAALKSVSEKYDAMAATLPPVATLTPKPKTPLKQRDAAPSTVKVEGAERKVGDEFVQGGRRKKVVAIKNINGVPHAGLQDLGPAQ
jgi:hypothetical protein